MLSYQKNDHLLLATKKLLDFFLDQLVFSACLLCELYGVSFHTEKKKPSIDGVGGGLF